MPELSTETVEALFRQCLADDTSQGAVIEGIVTKAAFSPAAVEAHRAEIGALLAELPEGFRADSGGGWSFLNACLDQRGNVWTSFQRTAEHLLMLGMAAGQVKELLPREMWDTLPGGVPYYVITATS